MLEKTLKQVLTIRNTLGLTALSMVLVYSISERIIDSGLISQSHNLSILIVFLILFFLGVTVLSIISRLTINSKTAHMYKVERFSLFIVAGVFILISALIISITGKSHIPNNGPEAEIINSKNTEIVVITSAIMVVSVHHNMMSIVICMSYELVN